MAKEIDLTKPLNEDEIKYLVDRCRWRDLRLYCANMGLEEPNLPDAAGIRRADPTIGVNANELPGAYKALALAGEPQASKAFEQAPEQPEGAETGEPRRFGAQPPPAPQEPDQGAEGEGSTPPAPDYKAMTVAQLQAKLDERREDAVKEEADQEIIENLSYTRDDRKDDLVAKLELDDATLEDDENDDN